MRKGGPGGWMALLTLVGVIVILFGSFFLSARENEFYKQSLTALTAIAETNQTTLAELRAAIAAGPETTNVAILALINDNRRTHGCRTVASIEELSLAPTCSQKSTVVTVPVPGPVVTVPVPAAAPTTVTTTTTTTIAGHEPPGQKKKNCLLGIICL